MSNRLTYIIAGILLAIMFLMAIFSIKDDSLTMDELAHLPAGYSYLVKKDMRLNPEHPPLIKDLAALPLLFLKGIKFPESIKDWQEDINGQWGFGHYFLYKTGNPVEKMIFLARIPMILILMLLGFYLFKWTRELFGNRVSLLALFLFSFSPTFLAHGRLVTTDVGAATGVFISTYYFLKALKEPTKKNLLLAGISFGLAQLAKFTTILLVPFFGFLTLTWALLKANQRNEGRLLRRLTAYGLRLTVILIIGLLLIWAVYQYHVWNYPGSRQARDIEFLLSSHLLEFLGPSLAWMAQKPVLRALAQYLLGLSMVSQRATGGHTTYFLGEVSASGWRNYFPIVYIIKESLAFHILTAISLILLAWKIKRPFWQEPKERLSFWIKKHFTEFSMLSFIFLYWTSSISSPLNIGVRHLLPVFPFTIILVCKGVIDWLESSPHKIRTCSLRSQNLDFSLRSKIKYILLAILMVWQALSVISIYPHFLTYFNEIVGGPERAYIYTVNSNLDWGQDLKGLAKWVEEQGIEKIYVDYFGGSDVKFYLKEKFNPWWGTRDKNELPPGSYLAVSASFYQGGRGKPVLGFNQPHSYYLWLSEERLVKKIGYSIFVFYID